MTTKKDEHEPAVKDAEPVGSPELSSPAPRQPGTPPDPSSPKTPGTPSREPRGGERPEEVKIALLDVNRQEISREMIAAADAGFRIVLRGTAWERVGTTEDGIPAYALTS